MGLSTVSSKLVSRCTSERARYLVERAKKNKKEREMGERERKRERERNARSCAREVAKGESGNRQNGQTRHK